MKSRLTLGIRNLMYAVWLLSASAAFAQYTLLHEFTGAGDGGYPTGDLTLSGTTLYGMTSGGGNGGGTIFQLKLDGSGYQIVHNFGGTPGAGIVPYGSLTLSGSTFFGMTHSGGASSNGTVFRLNTDGSGYETLHSFAGGANDGDEVLGTLALSGSTLYGMTAAGGDSDLGTIFRMNIDGSGYQILHEFAGGVNDGNRPFGSLTLSGSSLYGTTYFGGDFNNGTVFKIDTDGNGFQLLHEFLFATEGARPQDSLAISGTTLYGMTNENDIGGSGGGYQRGTVFRLDTDGSDFQILHRFFGGLGNADGARPIGSPTVSRSVIYGMTAAGGTSNLGTVFQMNTDGSDYQVLRSFTGGANDGSVPHGALTVSGSTLYGMTGGGGDSNLGTIFRIIPEPSSLILAAMSGLGFLVCRRPRQAAAKESFPF